VNKEGILLIEDDPSGREVGLFNQNKAGYQIKNPLHALAGTAEVVDPLIPANAEERHLWEVHMAEIERLRRVADRFLSLSSPAPLEVGPLDLRDVCERLVALVGVDARQKRVTLDTGIPDDRLGVSGSGCPVTATSSPRWA